MPVTVSNADLLAAIESLRKLIEERCPALTPLLEATPAVSVIEPNPLWALQPMFTPPAHDAEQVLAHLAALSQPDAEPVALDLPAELNRTDLARLRDHYQRAATSMGLPLAFYVREAGESKRQGQEPRQAALIAARVKAEAPKP